MPICLGLIISKLVINTRDERQQSTVGCDKQFVLSALFLR
jgi:hypothetical protein